jgi:glycosyltransferase involved in cell wall biosynthesis
MNAAAVTGVPFVVHFRGSDLSAHCKVGVLKERYRCLLRLADGVICKSQPMAQSLQQLGADPSRLLISASGANTALFHGSAPLKAEPVFLAVGRFVPKKGPLHTIRAFQQQPFGQLWMVGEGPLLQQARALVQDLGLQDRVRFFGALPQEQVADLMRVARVFVQHSMVAADGDSEGNPVSVMEAQLSGLPVVATRHGGIPEVVLDQQTGCLVEEGDVLGMAEAMEGLMADPARAERFGAAGRRRILAGFTLDHHLDDLTRFLQAVMDGPLLRERA